MSSPSDPNSSAQEGTGYESPSSAPLGALAPWFGGKRSLAPMIVRQCCFDGVRGKYRTPGWFGEPFCGSMAVSLAMPEVSTHVVNDLHVGLTTLALVLASEHGPTLVSDLRDVLACESVFLAMCAEYQVAHPKVAAMGDGKGWAMGGDGRVNITDEHYQLAISFAVREWLGPNGLAGTKHADRFCKRYHAGGGDPAKRWRNVPESFELFMGKLRQFTILREDAIGMIRKALTVISETSRKANDPFEVLYLDPPYLPETRTSGMYEHDFRDPDLFDSTDLHVELAGLLTKPGTANRIVVSYYDHPRLDDLYPADGGWHKLRRPVNKGVGNASGSGVTQAFEALLINEAPAPMTTHDIEAGWEQVR